MRDIVFFISQLGISDALTGFIAIIAIGAAFFYFFGGAK